jgi:CBS domain-containing protein
MSTNPERAVSYVLNKSVTSYMDKDVLLLGLNTQTREAARMLRHYETDDIIVTDENNLPVGIVTDEDILSSVSDVTVYAEATTLKDVMTTPLITINEKSTLQDALHKMRDNNIRKLPVLSKKNQVVGMIFQSVIANVIREATSTSPRLLSPPVKAVLGNLGQAFS